MPIHQLKNRGPTEESESGLEAQFFGSRWGARGKIFCRNGGGCRHGEERWRHLGEGEVVEQCGERERPNLGEGERVERLEREEFGVAGGERLVSVRVAESRERRSWGIVAAMR